MAEQNSETQLEIPKQGTRAARQAKLTVRHAVVKLKPPAYRRSEPLPLIEVSPILAQEQAASVGSDRQRSGVADSRLNFPESGNA